MLQASRPATLLKRDSNTSVLRTALFVEHLWWLLLDFQTVLPNVQAIFLFTPKAM